MKICDAQMFTMQPQHLGNVSHQKTYEELGAKMA